MSSSVNLLGLPKEKFGSADIFIGNLVSQEVEKQGKGFKAQYNPETNQIVVLNTSDLPPSILNKILYESFAVHKYDEWGWYPVVREKRDKDGNLEIGFSYLKPGMSNEGGHRKTTTFAVEAIVYRKFSTEHKMDKEKTLVALSQRADKSMIIGGMIVEESPHIFSEDTPVVQQISSMMSSNWHTPKFYVHEGSINSDIRPQGKAIPSPSAELEEPEDQEELENLSKTVSKNVVDTMSQFFNKHDLVKGVWYPADYSKYLMNEFEIEMDASFFTGFADKAFFEKTGRFTFKLKEGEKASEAILRFLEGPTVADCGNAITACYYKCMLDIIGKNKFNQAFSSSSDFPLIIDQLSILNTKSPISFLAEFTEASKQGKAGVLGKRPLQIGDQCHFYGVIWYGNKHPEGFGGGWNVIYIGDDTDSSQLFLGHGFEKPLTEKEINQKLIEFYNRERTPQDKQYVANAKNPKLYDKKTNEFLIKNYTISLEEAEKNPENFIKGFRVESVQNLNIKKLLKLSKSQNIPQFMANRKS